MNVRDVLDLPSFAPSARLMTEALRGARQSFVRTLTRPDGVSDHHRLEYVPDVRDGIVRGIYALVTDVTDIHESHRKIRLLAQRLETVREDERTAAAHVLHEGIAQELFAASMTLDYLKSHVPGGNGVGSAWNELTTIFAKCLDTTRQLANDLRPTALSHLRLSVVLREHAKHFGAISRLSIDVREAADFPELDEQTRLVLFRVAQEALTNVAKHAQASTVSILLRAEAGSIVMTISDDGKGMTAKRPGPVGGLGLLGIQERIAARGGELTIGANEPRGTRVKIRLPAPDRSRALDEDCRGVAP